MQRLIFVVYQLDEARRYIEGGRLEQLRLALLRLDNAAEMQLEHRIRQERFTEEIWERLHGQVEAIGALEAPELADIASVRPLSKAEKHDIARNFDGKLRYLSERHSILDRRLARVLGYAHRYRNEAYHEGRVRKDTIRTAAMILFETNLELLTGLYQVSYGSSSEDYSWLDERFGLSTSLAKAGDLDQIALTLREGFIPTVDATKSILKDHLESRVAELSESLDFIVDGSSIPDRASALLVAQEEGPRPATLRRRSSSSRTSSMWTLDQVEAYASEISAIGDATDRLAAFEVFAGLEEKFEPIEERVHALSAAIDQAIQDEVDRIRGK
jgi:hypothetical protein